MKRSTSYKSPPSESSPIRSAAQRRRRHLVAFAAVGLAAALAMTGCSATSAGAPKGGDSAATGTYTIGVVTSQTGGFSAAGFDAQQGGKIAESVFSKELVGGKKLKFVYVDDATASDVSFQACTRLVTQEKVDAVVSDQLVANTAACQQALAASGTPFINADQNPGILCAPNIFTTGAVNNQLILPVTQYLLDQGHKKFYLIGSDSAAPKTGLPMAAALIQANGGTVVATDFVPGGTSDYSGFISRIASAKPDVVLDAISDTTAVQFYKQLTTDPRTKSMTKAGFTATTSQIAAVGASAKGYVLQSIYFDTLGTEASKAYNKAANKLFGSKAEKGSHGVRIYSGVAMIVKALEKAGSTSPTDVLKALASAKVSVPQGAMEFNPKYGRFAAQPALVGEMQGDGTVKVLENRPVAPTGTCTN